MTPSNPTVAAVERSVVSTSKFPSKSSLDAIARHLRTIKATGKLTINFSQGGTNSIIFEAHHKLNGYDHIELKFEGD